MLSPDRLSRAFGRLRSERPSHWRDELDADDHALLKTMSVREFGAASLFAAATRARRERFPASYRPGLNLRPACAPRKMARLGLSYVVPERTYQSTYQSPSRVEPIVPDLAILRASRT